MSSTIHIEESNAKQSVPVKQESMFTCSGIKLFGYEIKWWVVLLVVGLLIWFACSKGYLGCGKSSQSMMMTPMPALDQMHTIDFGNMTGGGYGKSLDIPLGVKSLFDF